MKIKTTELYTFDELPKESQRKALDNNRYLNVEFGEWWDFDGLTGFSEKEGKEYGFTRSVEWDDLLTYDRMYFSIDRDWYLQFVNPRFNDLEQARKFLGISPKLWERAQNCYYFRATDWRNGSTVLNFEGYDENGGGWTRDEQDQLDEAQERFSNKREDCLRILRDEYEEQTSDEAIKDTLIAKDYYFDLSGEIQRPDKEGA